jgi:hypothetical protein
MAARRCARAAKAEQRKAAGREKSSQEKRSAETGERQTKKQKQKRTITEPAEVLNRVPRKKQPSAAVPAQNKPAKSAKGAKKAPLPTVSIAIGGIEERVNGIAEKCVSRIRCPRGCGQAEI